MNLKLIDVIKAESPEEWIYIGAKNGSGWMCIAHAEHLMDVRTLDRINIRRKALVKKKFWNTGRRARRIFMRRKMLQEVSIADRDKLPKHLESLIGVESKDTNEKFMLKIQQQIEQDADSFRRAIKRMKRLKNYLRSWTDLKDARCAETHCHDTYPQGKCILINGYWGDEETFWTIDEFNDMNHKGVGRVKP